jgi:hypothetical protein
MDLNPTPANLVSVISNNELLLMVGVKQVCFSSLMEKFEAGIKLIEAPN